MYKNDFAFEFAIVIAFAVYKGDLNLDIITLSDSFRDVQNILRPKSCHS